MNKSYYGCCWKDGDFWYTFREFSSSPPKGETDEKNDWYAQLMSPPNLITISRIACTPVISYWIVTGQYKAALGGCLVAGLSDFADGYLAKHYGMATVLGSYLDPLADKLLINAVAISLWYSNPALLPAPLVALWFVKDAALMGETYRFVARQTNMTPLQVHPTNTSKINTALQFMTLAAAMVHPTADPAPLALQGLCWVTGATTLASAWSYVGYTAFEVSKTKPKSKSQ
jgi:cardiolipin synthase